MRVSQKQLAEVLGISTRRIRQLCDDEGLFRARDGMQYNLGACVRDYIAYKEAKGAKSEADLNYDREKAKHERAKRHITEMRLSRMRRESFDAADVEDAWAELMIGFRERASALPHKLGPIVIGVDDLATIVRTIEAEVEACLLELSQFSLEQINIAEEGVDDDETEDSEVDAGAAAPAAAPKKADRKRVGRRKPPAR